MEREALRGYRSLAAAVFIRALKDLRFSNDEESLAALRWLIHSEQARLILDSLGLLECEPLELLCRGVPKIKRARHKKRRGE